MDTDSKGEEDMNEQIKQLAEHCDFYVGNEHYDKPHEEQQRFFMEKFAELILEDVMSICEDLGDKGMDGHYCVDAIRNKFGLKEKNT